MDYYKESNTTTSEHLGTTVIILCSTFLKKDTYLLTLTNTKGIDKHWYKFKCLTCKVTIRSSTITSLVRKSAPMVALYWLVNFLLTYWFISDVLPTLESPSMITFNSTFFLVAMAEEKRKSYTYARQVSSPSQNSVPFSPLTTCDRKNTKI